MKNLKYYATRTLRRVGCLLFLVSPVLITLLVVSCEGEPPQRIYPENGLFMEDREFGYPINCELENLRGIDRWEVILVVNKSKNKVSMLTADGIPEVENVEFYSDEVSFQAGDVVYFLDRYTGEITAGRGYPEADGICIEAGWRWNYDKTNKELVYEKDPKFKFEVPKN